MSGHLGVRRADRETGDRPGGEEAGPDKRFAPAARAGKVAGFLGLRELCRTFSAV